MTNEGTDAASAKKMCAFQICSSYKAGHSYNEEALCIHKPSNPLISPVVLLTDYHAKGALVAAHLTTLCSGCATYGN
jgi:hypothetical protein